MTNLVFAVSALAAMVVVLATLSAIPFFPLAVPDIATTATATATVPVPVTDTAPETPSSVLPKTVFSSKLRLVLAVGVEGTGHKYMLDVDVDLFTKNDHLVQMPDMSMTRYNIRSAMGGRPQNYKASMEKARAEMRRVAQTGEDLPLPGTMMLIRGKYSYPHGSGQKKVMKYIDLRLLAEVAEKEGVDFRVLYLRRSVKDILVADTVHRHFQDLLGNFNSTTPEERYMQYVQIMLTDTAVMHSFLAELDPAFVICQDFERVGELEQSTSIAKFLAPNGDVAESLRSSLMDMAVAHGVSNESLPYEGAPLVTARLQRKFDVFESALCNVTP